MNLESLLILGHIIGTVLGVGGSTIAEMQIRRALKDGTLSEDEKFLMHGNYSLIRIGTLLIVISGIALVYVNWIAGNNWALMSQKLWAKEVITAIIILNAILLTKRYIPLKWGSAISLVSWWCAMILGVFGKVPFNFVQIMSGYVIIILIARYFLWKK